MERIPKNVFCAKFKSAVEMVDCQLGELEVAKARLAHAFKLDPSLRLPALNEADLAPVWNVRPAQ